MINPFNRLLDRQEQQTGGADLLLATVAAVTSGGLTLIPDGETEATRKKYKYMTSAYPAPAAGDRVVVMRLSGTYVVLGRIGTSTPETEQYVRRSGDTMTGGLKIISAMLSMIANSITLGTRPESNKWSAAFAFLDSAEKQIGRLMAFHGSNGTAGIQMYGEQPINGTTKYNYLGLYMSDEGAGVVDMNYPAAWRKALGLGNTDGALPLTIAQGGTGNTSVDTTPTAGSSKMVTSGGVKTALDGKVSKTGDTMTGDLNLKSTSHTIGTAPSATASDRRLYFRDLAGTVLGKLQNIFTSANAIGMQLGAQRTVNGSLIENNVSLYVNEDGTRSVAVTEAAKWRAALGLGSSGDLPLTIGQGGTGATGLVKVTGSSGIFSSVASGFSVSDAVYAQWGKMAMVSVLLVPSAAGTTTNWKTWATLASGKRPAAEIAAACSATTYCLIGTDGAITLSLKESANVGYRVSATYLLA